MRPKKNTARNKEVAGTMKQRGAVYGDFTDGALFSQTCLDAAQAGPNWKNLTPVQKSSISHILQKMQRVVCGDANHRDTWVDIAGYAMLAADRIGKTTKKRRRRRKKIRQRAKAVAARKPRKPRKVRARKVREPRKAK